jgi:hypothetical protein
LAFARSSFGAPAGSNKLRIGFSQRFSVMAENEQNGLNPTIRCRATQIAAARTEITLKISIFSPAVPEVRTITGETPLVFGQRFEAKGAL